MVEFHTSLWACDATTPDSRGEAPLVLGGAFHGRELVSALLDATSDGPSVTAGGVGGSRQNGSSLGLLGARAIVGRHDPEGDQPDDARLLTPMDLVDARRSAITTAGSRRKRRLGKRDLEVGGAS